MSSHQSELPGGVLEFLKRLGTNLTYHANWLKVLHRSLICGEQAPADDLKKDAHHLCAFGRWYYSEPDPKLRSLPQYERVGELHQRVHDEAVNLLNLKQDGQEIATGNYEIFMTVAHEFRTAVQSLQFDMFSQVCAVDHLTGVWNRYALSHKLSQEFERVQRTSLPVRHRFDISAQAEHPAPDRYPPAAAGTARRLAKPDQSAQWQSRVCHQISVPRHLPTLNPRRGTEPDRAIHFRVYQKNQHRPGLASLQA